MARRKSVTSDRSPRDRAEDALIKVEVQLTVAKVVFDAVMDGDHDMETQERLAALDVTLQALTDKTAELRNALSGVEG